MIIEDTLTAFLAYARNAGCQQLVVAYSGGIDSHVLLSQLSRLNKGEKAIPLKAIYINHNLHPDANRWGQHCQNICQAETIPFQQIDVEAKPEAGESPEEKARIVRYQALEAELQENHWLLTAQHKDDQAETLLLQLLRGSGAQGLSAMPVSRPLGRGLHYRPLLEVDKTEIEKYAELNRLNWIEDPSNCDLSIARNYLRNTIMPDFKKVWPETPTMFSRSAAWLSEASEMMSDIAEEDLQFCMDEAQAIAIDSLKKLSYIRQKNLLRHWFHQLGLKRPGTDKLELIFEQIIDAREDANPRLDWQGKSLSRYKNKLYLFEPSMETDSDWKVSWDAMSSIALADNWASLNVEEVLGRGLSSSFRQRPLTLQLRQGGEKCHPAERSNRRSLKKLFHEYSVPPWLRERWPLLYCGDQLIAVPGLFICKGFEAKPSESGIIFSLDYTRF